MFLCCGFSGSRCFLRDIPLELMFLCCFLLQAPRSGGEPWCSRRAADPPCDVIMTSFVDVRAKQRGRFRNVTSWRARYSLDMISGQSSCMLLDTQDLNGFLIVPRISVPPFLGTSPQSFSVNDHVHVAVVTSCWIFQISLSTKGGSGMVWLIRNVCEQYFRQFEWLQNELGYRGSYFGIWCHRM